MCAGADDRTGWMVLKVRWWGSVMMQAAKSPAEDMQHACV